MSPLGLNAPTSFQFSPISPQDSRNGSGNAPQPRYLSFVSCHTKSDAEYTSFSGSPVRTIGSRGGSSIVERRLCVMDLKPFWKRDACLEDTEEHRSEEIGNIDNMLDPKYVMDNHMVPLLNTNVQPLKDDGNNSSSKPGTNTKTLMEDSESTMPLEERLRRERQRLSSSGITQFDWVRYRVGSSERECREEVQPVERNHDCDQPRRSCRGPHPEDVPSITSSPSQFQRNKKIEPIMQQTHLKQSEDGDNEYNIRLIIPLQGNIYIQDGVGPNASPIRLLYEKSMLENVPPGTIGDAGQSSPRRHARSKGSVVGRDASAIDPQLSPDGTMVAFVVGGEIHVMSCSAPVANEEEEQHTITNKVKGAESMNIDERYDGDSARRTSNSSCDRAENGAMRPTQVTFGAIIDEEISHEREGNNSRESSIADYSGASKKKYGRSITHGLADFVAQEEMDRYRGFWWDPKSRGILFARVDESCVPPYRIVHQGKDESTGDQPNYEDHRYPFAGKENPKVLLGYVPVNRTSILGDSDEGDGNNDYQSLAHEVTSRRKRRKNVETDLSAMNAVARSNWSQVKWFHPPSEASEYLARVHWLPNGCACLQWQDRRQSLLILTQINVRSGESNELLRERSKVWINLHHMFKVLPYPIHPEECLGAREAATEPLPISTPSGSFSFLFASERTGYCHLYLYTYIPSDTTSKPNNSATLLRAVSSGEWVIESILGVDMKNNTVYVTGTYDSPLERHLYALPLLSKSCSEKNDVVGANTELGGSSVRRGLKHVISSISGVGSGKPGKQQHDSRISTAIDPRNPPSPLRLTKEPGMHSIVMDEGCHFFVDTSSDLCRPTTVKVFSLPSRGPLDTRHPQHESSINLSFVSFDASLDFKTIGYKSNLYPPPEIISFPTSDGTEALYAALYRPNPKIHGPGPYPIITSVYGGPHVQRVNRSWCQCADMRIQRLCALGFAVIKCDNRGSARRGLAFECAIKHNLGRIEVLDQVTAVRYLVSKRIGDARRVGIYGWSYGGYLAAMCLCRAPDVFHVAVAGAPVTSWDGYDTHYTERYMGLPNENLSGYHESALFEHTPNMRGKLMIIHGLIDENVHFRHTARLINRLIAAGKDYDLLLFPEERHSPTKLRDRVYMEKRISDYFVNNLLGERQMIAKERKMPGYL